jgi:flavin reductase (DIM6/NTAB) family NADH-FMN oxidoreductase RutF
VAIITCIGLRLSGGRPVRWPAAEEVGVERAVPDEIVNKVLWRIPNVLCLVGSRSGDEWNAMTTSWVTQVSMEPVLVAVGVDRSAVTNRLIATGGSFTVNLWDRGDTRPFVKFSKPASKDGMNLNGRPVREGVTGAPVFTEAVAYIECRVWQAIECGSHTLFLGEVADCGFREGAEEVPVARMEDTRMKYGGVRRGGH